jgi:hypothetical protein
MEVTFMEWWAIVLAAVSAPVLLFPAVVVWYFVVTKISRGMKRHPAYVAEAKTVLPLSERAVATSYVSGR